MDFVTGFPKSKRGNDAIFVVIDKLTKVAHFLPIKESITAAQLAELYTSRIVSLHGIPQLISSDRGSIFTSKFWDSFQKAMGTNIRFSTAFHPQTSGQVERVNQILEICSGLVSSLSAWSGKIVFHRPSSPTTTAYKRVRARPHSRFSMAGSDVLLLTGQRLVNANFS